MLDLILSFFSFLILFLKLLVAKFAFQPPNENGYKVTEITDSTTKEKHNKIEFLIPNNQNKKCEYRAINFPLINISYITIKEKNLNIPAIILEPRGHFNLCIIYSHGNSGDIGNCIYETYNIALNTYSTVVSYEYPGFGLCKNRKINEVNVYKHLRATYNYVRNVLKYSESQIILFGFSIGTGISFDLACRSEFPVAGLILQAPYLSLLRIVYNIKTKMFFDMFHTVSKVKYLKCPTLIIHGNRDNIIPYVHGRILAELIPPQFNFHFITVDGADHNNIIVKYKDYIFKGIRNFIMKTTNIDYCQDNSECIDN